MMNYYRHIDHSRFLIDFVDMYGNSLPWSDEMANEVEKFGGKIYRLQNYKRHPIKVAFCLKQIIKDGHYDIIHENMPSTGKLIPVLVACADRNAPVVISHSHGSNISSGLLRYLCHNISTKILPKMKIQKWACSEAAGKFMWGRQFNREDVIPNAINASKFRKSDEKRNSLRELCGFKKDDKVIGFVGRITEVKNPLFLLQILMELKKTKAGYKLLIVGDGNLMAELQTEMRQLQLGSDVYFTGRISDTSAWYSVMDAFVLPSLHEGFGIVGLEAQACGLPVFVSNHIPKELDVTNTVIFLPIDKGAKIWTNTIHETLQKTQPQKVEFPKEYDITYATKILEERYTQLSLKREQRCGILK